MSFQDQEPWKPFYPGSLIHSLSSLPPALSNPFSPVYSLLETLPETLTLGGLYVTCSEDKQEVSLRPEADPVLLNPWRKGKPRDTPPHTHWGFLSQQPPFPAPCHFLKIKAYSFSDLAFFLAVNCPISKSEEKFRLGGIGDWKIDALCWRGSLPAEFLWGQEASSNTSAPGRVLGDR